MNITIRSATPEDAAHFDATVFTSEFMSMDGLVVLKDDKVIAAVDEYGSVRYPGMMANQTTEGCEAMLDRWYGDWIGQMVFAAAKLYEPR